MPCPLCQYTIEWQGVLAGWTIGVDGVGTPVWSAPGQFKEIVDVACQLWDGDP